MEQSSPAYCLRFQMTRADSKALYVYYHYKRPQSWLQPIFIIALVGIMLYLQKVDLRDLGWFALMPVAIFVPAIALFKLITYRETMEAPRKVGIFDTPSECGISEEFFYYKDATGASATRWEFIHRIIGEPNHLFVFPNELNAYIIPRRAFDSAEQCDMFLQNMTEYHQAAKAKVKLKA